jgi:hypothetical protein
VKVFAISVAALAVLLALPVSAGAGVPARGVLAPGVSLGGVRLGDSDASVRARLGDRDRLCGVCRRTTWLYVARAGTPRGFAVSFRDRRVVAIFTLGAPRGWRTSAGVALGDPTDKAVVVYGQLPWRSCIGYGALSMRRPGVVTSIYTFGESVYGFALTRPSEPVCQ